MNTLLVIGSDGWLGNAITYQLNKKFLESLDIKQIILHSKYKMDPKFKLNKKFHNNEKLNYLYGDFLLKKTFDNLKNSLKKSNISNLYVIVTLGIIHPAEFNQFEKINYQAIKNIYKICLNFNLIKFTYISSNSPFGFNTKNIPFDESTPYNSFGGYGKTKKKTEQYLLKVGRKDVVTILRAPWFHGNNMPSRQKRFLISASKGKFPLVFFGKNIRSIINVKDLAIASLLVTSEKRKHQIYWICENNKTMSELIDIIKCAANYDNYSKKFKTIPNLYLPPGFSSFFFIVDIILQKLGIYNMYIHVFSEIGQNIFADNSRYLEEFSDKHYLTNFEQSIHDELKEAFYSMKINSEK